MRYTRDGHNIWPALAWTDLPAGTEELALVSENIPQQTKAPFVQWLVYEISPDAGGPSENCKHKADPRGAVDVV